jgi:hypothetical protein
MRIHREIIIRTVESVFCHGVEEDRALMAVERGRLLEDEGGHRFDVEHRNILSMELGLLHVPGAGGGDQESRATGPPRGGSDERRRWQKSLLLIYKHHWLEGSGRG